MAIYYLCIILGILKMYYCNTECHKTKVKWFRAKYFKMALY